MVTIINALTEFGLDDVVSLGSVNLRCQQFNQQFPVSIANGGTGATSAAQARANLGILKSEPITFTGIDTLTLSKSIKDYKYIAVIYSYTFGWPRYNSTCFSVDVLGSTASHALTVTDEYGEGVLVVSALMGVSGSGKTITLSRNKGFLAFMGGWEGVQENEKIRINYIRGYK